MNKKYIGMNVLNNEMFISEDCRIFLLHVFVPLLMHLIVLPVTLSASLYRVLCMLYGASCWVFMSYSLALAGITVERGNMFMLWISCDK